MVWWGERKGRVLGGLQRLFKCHLRQNGGQALGQHALAGARRADEQHVVAAAGSDLQCALGLGLPLYIGKIQRLWRGGVPILGHGRRELQHAPQIGKQLGDIPNAIHLQPLNNRALPGVFRRDKQPLKPSLPGLVGHGQHAPNGPQLPREGKLPQEDGVLRVARKLPGGFEQRDQQGQVVDGALFLLVGRGQVHGDAADGKVKAAVLQGRAHPVPGFLHRRVRQAHQLEGGQPLREVRFHFYRKCLHAIKAHAVYFRHHPHTPSFLGNAGFIIRQLCREYNALLKNAAQFCGRKEELDETVLHGI